MDWLGFARSNRIASRARRRSVLCRPCNLRARAAASGRGIDVTHMQVSCVQLAHIRQLAARSQMGEGSARTSLTGRLPTQWRRQFVIQARRGSPVALGEARSPRKYQRTLPRPRGRLRLTAGSSFGALLGMVLEMEDMYLVRWHGRRLSNPPRGRASTGLQGPARPPRLRRTICCLPTPRRRWRACRARC